MAIVRYAQSTLPTEYGDFRIVVYRDGTDEHVAMVRGDVERQEVLARVHSSCLTGETLGSLRCDCKAQLDLAMARIAEAGAGVILYLLQEGRGIGLGNKIKAYALQDQGVDTVDANVELGFDPDQRSYRLAGDMLKDLGVGSVALMTNNPKKVEGLAAEGIEVVKQVPHWVGENQTNKDYLQAKRRRMGHLKE